MMTRKTFAGILVVTIVAAFFSGPFWSNRYDSATAHIAAPANSGVVCKIAVVPLVGEITSWDGGTYTQADFEEIEMVSADQVLAAFHEAQQDENIKGLLLRIDSPGGGPVASEMIANALKRLGKPSVALIRETGLSGAYLAATGADTIIASPFSDVGCIGITMSYLDNSEKNESEGMRFVSLASAPFKECRNPNKPLTAAERALLERDLKIYHDQFVKEVAENRSMSIATVAELADGSTLPGELALETGLIDALGDQESARMWFAEQLEVSPDEIVFCE